MFILPFLDYNGDFLFLLFNRLIVMELSDLVHLWESWVRQAF